MGRGLDARFDTFLCQAHHLRTLFLLMNDEVLHIRVDAIKLLGRLAALNPAYVLPGMRHTLLRLLIELQFGLDTGSKEEASQMLCHFLRANALHSLVRPFMRSIVRTLPIHSNARLAAVALEALGELAVVMKEETTPYLEQLVPMTIENIQDQSSAHKREMALRTLGQLSCSTGYVIKPYFQYPTLLPKILAVLREGGNAMPWSLRREVLRTFGILGALDPYKFQTIQERLRKAAAAAATSSSAGTGESKVQPLLQQQQQQLQALQQRDQAGSPVAPSSAPGPQGEGGEGGGQGYPPSQWWILNFYYSLSIFSMVITFLLV